jgi:hypothetical protein
VLFLIFCDTGRFGARLSIGVRGSKPWFSNRIEPGSSAGRSGVDGREIERGRLGRGLSRESGLEYEVAYGAGDRSKSSEVACIVDAALGKVAL